MGCSSSPRVAKVSFTGSVATGRLVGQSAAANIKPSTLELGGKSALIIFEDADVNDAVEWAMVSLTPPPPLPTHQFHLPSAPDAYDVVARAWSLAPHQCLIHP